MPKLNQTVLIPGILAGICAAFLTLGATAQSSMSFLLYAASAMPVLVAGLGWGNVSAIIAILSAGFLGALAVSPVFAVTIAIFTLIPAGWLSHLANLARPASELGGPDDLMAWYPLSGIVLHLCALITVSVIVLGTMIGYGPDLVSQLVDVMMASVQTREAAFTPDATALAQTKTLLVLMLPMVQGGLWVIMLFAAYYFASRAVRSFGKGLRPREDIAAALRMHRNAIFIFLGGIVLTFLGGTVAMVGAVVCGTFGAGFIMAGYASLHHRSKGKDWRWPVLVLAYISAVFVFPLLLILVLGLSDVRSTISLTPPRNPDNNETKP
ncbi:DUF2232 domain-containing protein [Agrobacterium rosae]|uniref:DUF2232 domain-containing protein n=1 Tax=Agrobacterium rosae TaxID=1972867 RepID=A0AAE5RXH6_9HYPH|nr:DUF2232 domain-containing protein [Agrobacterium rosae]KAA3514525.1 DUF2232 domain-containing protein [Agrobacterium rosae]KAA3523188.1 DUF2232 domain-containing protein [Agrobacterium rosae]MCM2433480.1 DUF2232 domain-containing protein [Agrobacterium rosae]MDX8329967.1 DUF2232 domain-containing protein [Agrobacterium rosae]MQB47928.1 DUF2232 domain-containing protein [Agrobacterium rosae]